MAEKKYLFLYVLSKKYNRVYPDSNTIKMCSIIWDFKVNNSHDISSLIEILLSLQEIEFSY